MKPMNVNKLAIETARSLRKKSTKAEKAFWNIVRNRKLNGMKFNRQFPIVFDYDGGKKNIADFYCHEAHLIVEIDGSINDYHQDHDAIRDNILQTIGYVLVRYKNKEVMKDVNLVLMKLKRVINKLGGEK